jgi:hypothetical protein
MRDVAIQFLKAWKSQDYDEMLRLMDDDASINGTAAEIGGGPWNIGFAEWVNQPFDERCRAHGYEFPCETYEIANASEDEHRCREASPAEAANGYGRWCMFRLVYAERELGETSYGDGSMCVAVQAKGAALTVTEASVVWNSCF